MRISFDRGTFGQGALSSSLDITSFVQNFSKLLTDGFLPESVAPRLEFFLCFPSVFFVALGFTLQISCECYNCFEQITLGKGPFAQVTCFLFCFYGLEQIPGFSKCIQLRAGVRLSAVGPPACSQDSNMGNQSERAGLYSYEGALSAHAIQQCARFEPQNVCAHSFT
jgi:hypothetical protein